MTISVRAKLQRQFFMQIVLCATYPPTAQRLIANQLFIVEQQGSCLRQTAKAQREQIHHREMPQRIWLEHMCSVSDHAFCRDYNEGPASVLNGDTRHINAAYFVPSRRLEKLAHAALVPFSYGQALLPQPPQPAAILHVRLHFAAFPQKDVQLLSE